MKDKTQIKISIVLSEFQKTVSDNLEKNCVETLLNNGITKEQIVIVWVPGSLEIPLVVKKIAKKNSFDAIIVFGAIHKGDTYHFEQIANECIRGCMDISWQYEIPVIYEVLAVYNIKDAMIRATRKKENKGVEGALAALRMIEVINTI